MARALIDRPLNKMQLDFVHHYLANGLVGADAARKAGYSSKGASLQAYTLLKDPRIKALVEKNQRNLMQKNQFGMDRAMKEVEEAKQFAKLRNNPMAMVKAVELQCKLAGLLIEKHDIQMNIVNIDAALIAAAERLRPLLIEQPKPDIIIEGELVEEKVEPLDAAKSP